MSPDEEKEEKDIIFSLDSYVILEYIKSSVDIILNLKFEEIEKKLIDKNNSIQHHHHQQPKKARKSSGSLNNNNDIIGDTIMSPQPLSSTRSNFSNMEGPPKIYEEVI